MCIVFTDFLNYFSERARRKVAGCQGRAEVLAEASTGPGKSSTSYWAHTKEGET